MEIPTTADVEAARDVLRRHEAAHRARTGRVGGRPCTRVCECGRTDGTHSARCPISARERMRRVKDRQRLEEKNTEK